MKNKKIKIKSYQKAHIQILKKMKLWFIKMKSTSVIDGNQVERSIKKRLKLSFLSTSFYFIFM